MAGGWWLVASDWWLVTVDVAVWLWLWLPADIMHVQGQGRTVRGKGALGLIL